MYGIRLENAKKADVRMAERSRIGIPEEKNAVMWYNHLNFIFIMSVVRNMRVLAGGGGNRADGAEFFQAVVAGRN